MTRPRSASTRTARRDHRPRPSRSGCRSSELAPRRGGEVLDAWEFWRPGGALADRARWLGILQARSIAGGAIPADDYVLLKAEILAGVDTIETVLLYHVVPGKTLTSNKVLKANGAKLKTAAGETVKVKIRQKPSLSITLMDKDKNDTDPQVVLKAPDLNKGNKQVAHGIDQVLRPIDL